jgi:hypothetical protein
LNAKKPALCRLFCAPFLLPRTANFSLFPRKRINSVDGPHAALEILPRSSYVPSIALGV